MVTKKSSDLDRLLGKAGFDTYEGLTSQVGIDRRTLWRWRTGRVPKRRSTLVVQVARALGVTPKKLLRMLHLHRKAG